MYGDISSTLYSKIHAPIAVNKDRLTRFGTFGVNVFTTSFSPPIGTPNKISVALKDEQKTVAWYLDKIIVIDAHKYYYEFLFDKWLNASTSKHSSIDDVHQDAILSRRYGGPESIQFYKCISNGSRVWYHHNNTMFKPGVITDISDSNVTVRTASGVSLVMPRPSGIPDSGLVPWIINDDSFTYNKNTPRFDRLIAVYNKSDVFYLGNVDYALSSGYTTSTISYRYTWLSIRLKFIYQGSKAYEIVHSGIVRKIDRVSTTFCTKDIDSVDKIDPQAIDGTFSCTDNKGLLGQIISTFTAANTMACGMICSRHAQCLSFNFCGTCGRGNCELNKAKDGHFKRNEYTHCIMVYKDVMS